MPIHKLLLKSGITTEASQSLAQGTWARSNHIRWRDGFLEKQFGFAVFTDELLTGVPRTLHAYQASDKSQFLIAGTHLRLELWSAGALNDITPLRTTAQNVAVAADTAIGSPTVVITDVAHGAATSDEVLFYVPISVGDVVLYGAYQITVIDADNYSVTAGANATANVTNGGAVPVFDTTNGSPNVIVTLANHGLIQGQSWEIDVSTAVGGLTLDGEYIVDAVLTANTFRIIASANAGSTATASENGGNARLFYYITAGLASTTAQIGWGAGTWGIGTWGVGTASATALTLLRIWSLDNFQDILLASTSDGALYKWTPPVAEDNRAVLVTGTAVPAVMRGMFVTTPQLQVVAFGAEVLGSQDPLLIRWSEAGDYTIWTATATNQAGSYRLSRGSEIVRGMQGPHANYFWTDIDFWTMAYIGLPNIFSFTLLATGCGLVGMQAVAQIGKVVYWMGHKGFFMFAGSGVQSIPCAVWDTIFQDLDTANADKVMAAADSAQGEIAFYYPSISGGLGENDKYVKLNVLTGEWDYGTSDQTAWIDQTILGSPIGAHADGDWHQHGEGYNAGESPLASMAETGYIDIAEGDQMIFLDQIIPDFVLMGTSPAVTLTINTKSHPFGDSVVSHGPYTVNANTKFITLRARARMMSLKIESSALDVWWRLGAIRVRVSPDGKMP